MEEARTARTVFGETPATIPPVSRPWQGTLLGGLVIFDLVIMATVIVLVLILSFGNGGLFDTITILIMSSFVLMVYIAKGLFVGKHWAVATLIFITSLTIAACIVSGIVSGNLLDLGSIIELIILGLLFKAEIICLKHPFYAKKAW